MMEAPSIDVPAAAATSWRTFVRTLGRTYPVTAPMIALIVLVPFYIFIAEFNVGRTPHVPATWLDSAIPLVPAWALAYGTVYLFLILLPIFLVRREQHVRQTFVAYLAVWVAAYGVFILYPTRASRPGHVFGDGFAAWGLRLLYDADPPYNCFPSLHVAHSFVSALTCYRVHRRVGIAALAAAGLVGVSTLFTKQHYVVDVFAGALLAWTASAVFLRTCPRAEADSAEHLAAPAVAVWTAALVGVVFAGAWIAYEATCF